MSLDVQTQVPAAAITATAKTRTLSPRNGPAEWITRASSINTMEGRILRGLWAVYYTSPQSFNK